mmetsp:Transcript_6455/g.19087  ORF Transcript_6455/g.19087 Transcript_6455/m.19087 type:complete len:525 (+) Transcript_6455:151-1725(+)
MCRCLTPARARAFPSSGSRLRSSNFRRNPAGDWLKKSSSFAVKGAGIFLGGGIISGTACGLMPRNSRFASTSTCAAVGSCSGRGTRDADLPPSASACMRRRKVSQRCACRCMSRTCMSFGTASLSGVNRAENSFLGKRLWMSCLLIKYTSATGSLTRVTGYASPLQTWRSPKYWKAPTVPIRSKRRRFDGGMGLRAALSAGTASWRISRGLSFNPRLTFLLLGGALTLDRVCCVSSLDLNSAYRLRAADTSSICATCCRPESSPPPDAPPSRVWPWPKPSLFSMHAFRKICRIICHISRARAGGSSAPFWLVCTRRNSDLLERTLTTPPSESSAGAVGDGARPGPPAFFARGGRLACSRSRLSSCLASSNIRAKLMAIVVSSSFCGWCLPRACPPSFRLSEGATAASSFAAVLDVFLAAAPRPRGLAGGSQIEPSASYKLSKSTMRSMASWPFLTKIMLSTSSPCLTIISFPLKLISFKQFAIAAMSCVLTKHRCNASSMRGKCRRNFTRCSMNCLCNWPAYNS